MEDPLISIVICTYNRADYLPKTLSSALSQDYSPFEVVVYDDGSRDETPQLMREYGSRIRYYWNENKGVAHARTEACKLAKGELIAFLDDDDIMPPDRLTLLMRAMTSHPEAVMAVGDWAEIDFDDQFTGRRHLPERKARPGETIVFKDGYEAVLWPKIPAAPHTTLFWKKYGERVGWFDPEYRTSCEDKDFFARIGRLGPIVYIPKIVSYYRRGHSSLTSKRMSSFYQRLVFLKHHLDSTGNNNRTLYKRLQLRMLVMLKKISALEGEGIRLPESIPAEALKDAQALLTLPGRVKYLWHKMIRVKIKKLVKVSFRNKKNDVH